MDRAWIEQRIPHKGSMCLLERVCDWGPETLTCETTTHQDPANPLRAEGRLGMSALIEYAAQAMAVHGALLAAADAVPAAGYLTSVRQVRWYRDRCDDLAAPLRITVSRQSGNATHVIYDFSIHCGELLATGRISAVLDAAALSA